MLFSQKQTTLQQKIVLNLQPNQGPTPMQANNRLINWKNKHHKTKTHKTYKTSHKPGNQLLYK